jgi:hypothetical protein
MVCKAGTSGSRIEYMEFSNHLSVTNITKIDNSRISDGVIRITSLAANWALGNSTTRSLRLWESPWWGQTP